MKKVKRERHSLYRKCDRFAVAKGSKFEQKGYDFSKNADKDVIKRKIARLYFSKIRVDPQKYEEIDIEGTEEFDLEGIKPDDLYLVGTYYKTKALIISTDNKLINVLKSKNIPCKLRHVFLQEYL
ncbi:MAG: hypothetical protein QME54_04530 [Actinomycetota bacterium]|nr:hypothetical protein [Actinomycetota bacterium]